MTNNDWGSLKEVLIHGVGIVIGSLITFPTVWILAMANFPVMWLYPIAVAGLLGPFMIIENKRKHINYHKNLTEYKKWEDFAKMKRPGWPWNKDEPLTSEEIQKYM